MPDSIDYLNFWFILQQLTRIPVDYSEYLIIIFVIYYLWFTLFRLIRSSGYQNFVNSLHQAPEMSLFTLTCLLILMCIPLRLLQLHRLEDVLASVIMFMLPLKLLFFCRASLSVGSFVVMIYKILVNDVLCFVVFLLIFVAGFSQCKFNYWWLNLSQFKAKLLIEFCQ